MESRRFQTIEDAERWYEPRAAGSPDGVDNLFLVVCRGDDERAERLYRSVAYPSRWWAEVTFAQAHYLIRLRRRDRLLGLARQLGVGVEPTALGDDPWAGVRSIADTVQGCLREGDGDASRLAVLYCLLGHAHLAMDFHEWANAAYAKALELDAEVSVPWENLSLLEYMRRDGIEEPRPIGTAGRGSSTFDTVKPEA